ncbi:MAG: hypothetical protein Q8904_10330 [Bacteroidota bacterium]|nr:hypothetical protein [Bacteroidota bacterium]
METKLSVHVELFLIITIQSEPIFTLYDYERDVGLNFYPICHPKHEKAIHRQLFRLSTSGEPPGNLPKKDL